MGHRPSGGPPPADLRGGPAGVSDVSRAHAGRRVHHRGVGDRPDPHPPPDPRRPRGARRATEPPLDAGLREPGHGTRPTPVRRRPDRCVRTAPRRPATTRGRSACAAVSPQRPRGPAGPGSPARTAGRTAREAHRRGGGRAEARAPVLARQGTGAYTRPTSIGFPILYTQYPWTAAACGGLPAGDDAHHSLLLFLRHGVVLQVRRAR